MFDYDRLAKDLNDMAFYILQCFKREYESYLSTVKCIKLDEMLKAKEIVVFDSLVGGNKIHINPCNERFKNNSYKENKNYYLNNEVLPEIFKFFITTNISKSEYEALSQPNLQQEFSLFLKKGFISYIINDFCQKYRLDLPEERNKDNLAFVKFMQTFLPDGRAFMELIFYYDYLDCMEKVFAYSGVDLLDTYSEYLNTRKNLEELIKTELSKTSMNEEEIEQFIWTLKNKSLEECIENFTNKLDKLYKNNKKVKYSCLNNLKAFEEDNLMLSRELEYAHK